MNYKISPRARLDLINIWEYTFEKWSVSQADIYYKILLDRIEGIPNNPSVGTNYNSARKGYRGLRVKSHIIFFRLVEDDKIEIIRILHTRMDIENRLNE